MVVSSGEPLVSLMLPCIDRHLYIRAWQYPQIWWWGSRTGAVKARVEKGRPRRGCQAGGLCLGRRGSALTRADDDGPDWGWEYKL